MTGSLACDSIKHFYRSAVRMQSAVTDEIVEKLKGITLLEASELVKVRLQINEFFSSPTTSSWYNARMG